MGCEEFSVSVRARAELARRQFCAAFDSGAVIPIGLREIDRMVIALAKKRAAARALRNNAEDNRLWPTQSRRGFIEVDLTGRADAFNVAPVRREIEIRFQNFVLRVMPLQFERAKYLFNLSRNGAGVEMKSQPRHLHRDCRSTGRRVMKASEINCAAQQCDRVYAGMLLEIFVFIAQRLIDQVC